ncbi:hypothetical protein BGZ63DRAFT_416826 [Mariannaea sp. PMI_226]|nr:hypothetical protein BGZ63DRAFT_416826 [Mariannaea sp. PMI_226]
MTRPTIVRADTIDLQDPVAPSAQDHSRGRLSAALASSSNTLAPHQAETIREISNHTADDESRSPRISWDGNNNIHDIHRLADDLGAGSTHDDQDDEHAKMSQEDALAIAQNGGISSSDEGDLDGDADDLDDDMMDKISSSPSIEDGGCFPVITRVAWPPRVSSLPPTLRTASQLLLRGSSGRRTPPRSLYTLKHMPYYHHYSTHPKLPRALPMVRGHHYLRGEYGEHDTNQIETAEQNVELDGRSDDEDRCKASREKGMDNPTMEREFAAAAAMDDNDDNHDDTMSLMIPYEKSFEDDDDSDLSFPYDPNYVDFGWAAECLQDVEDIDFEFVYALHTFVATVEGQANATKGDTMVLLDDSNSYWWLVRVVKDSSIGYLPAEHIETPTERLARLNKHRNVDLSAAMLGDQQDKKPQTFKSAIRLKRKTVAFAPPTYVDYSDFDDYSTDDEDLDELFAGHTSSAHKARQSEDKKDSQQDKDHAADDDTASEDSARVEPLKPRAKKEVRLVGPTTVDTVVEEDEARSSEEILLDTKVEPSRSRNGTVRNTDSFYKDETVETKKITLTPNLLRDDNQPRPSTESVTIKDKVRPSLERELMSDKEKKKLKGKEKEKEKKPSAIRSFFSRKDKKKTNDDDDDSFGKRSMDIESAGRTSESPSIEEPAADKLQRSPSKLQKQMPRQEPSSRLGSAGDKTGPSATMELAAYLNETRTNDVSNVPPATMRIVDSETNETQEIPSNHANVVRERSTPIKVHQEETKSHKSTRTKPKSDLDDFSSDDDFEEATETQTTSETNQGQAAVSAALTENQSTNLAKNDGAMDDKAQQRDRLSESPVQVSPVNGGQPPALEIDTSSQEGRSSEEVPSPELMPGEEMSKDSESSRSGREPAWDDQKLRAFFDESDHVRDLLLVVYDKTDVEPSKDHPVVTGLFREQNAKLAEITTQLDNMLGDWLARKQRSRGSL